MDSTDKKRLRAEAHSHKPVIMIGQAGLTPAVLAEIEIALDCHELLKVRIRAEREERQTIGDEIIASTGAEMIQMIGQIAVLYRANPEKRIKKEAPVKKPKPKKAFNNRR
ncbi:YhbY family RNA-binding protein [Methylomicrobium sp. Wu6]|uniref:YhbY family RNA-binding protein n=1 Tax=Methylomicrobium sp. Wu6 TaxID=3107928 RepID=UPI002DD6A4F6|nr:YhbY family RNA-binding protein [Methylomicrobium sp. Wu6]MEC4747901.1 YhbY family RNA-binding protein [Methylomicrobium sp. Wu6]